MDLKEYELELETFENCISLENANLNYTSYLCVNVPKVMPLIGIGRPNAYTNYVPKGVLLNNVKTHPRVNSSITISNYMRLPKANIPFYGKEVELGSKLTAIIINKNIKNIKFANI